MKTKQQLVEVVNDIIGKGIETLHFNQINERVVLDYVAIFAKTDEEFKEFDDLLESLAHKFRIDLTATGNTYKLKESLPTPYGILSHIKIRKPDPVRSQRGAPDFTVVDYEAFKEKYIHSSGNFTLMLRNDYEMVEIKGIDVYVYIPSKSITKRVKI